MPTVIMGDSDASLQCMLDMRHVRTAVVGVGGAGTNAVSRLQAKGCNAVTTIAVDTDAQSLYFTNVDQKLLIGKRVAKGWGTGGDFHVGELAAEEDLARIRQVTNQDIVFLACGLGGGTGSGAAPIFAREAQVQGALVVTFATLPFNVEGGIRKLQGYRGLDALAEQSDTVILIPNERLLGLPHISLYWEGFRRWTNFYFNL